MFGSRSHAYNKPLSDRMRSSCYSLLPRRLRRRGYRILGHERPHPSSTSIRRRKCLLWLQLCLGVIAALVVVTSLFNPSYTRLPNHYKELEERAQSSDQDGRANPYKQKVFIATSIYDEGGHLLGGAWGKAVLELIDLLGNENVFLSIYEDDCDGGAMSTQARFKENLRCRHSIICDTDFIMHDVPHVELPDGSRRIKRIAFLAEVRNKALQPLDEEAAETQFDRLLYLNDVVFDPVDAAQLLMSTNQNEDGKPSYNAACALDFINPFKFYDTFASRDAEGFSMGVPFFPWFTSSGLAISRQDVLQGKDAVRVKSCWGGMVAFDAKQFQAARPLRFRASQDLYWDASECCLIHADLVGNTTVKEGEDVGVYMNPFVRVAYGERTFKWLWFTRRFERLYTIPHAFINRLVGLPWFNPRRAERAGSKVDEKVWVPNRNLDTGGSFQTIERTATGDGFCGRRALQLLKEPSGEVKKDWELLPLPSG